MLGKIGPELVATNNTIYLVHDIFCSTLRFEQTRLFIILKKNKVIDHHVRMFHISRVCRMILYSSNIINYRNRLDFLYTTRGVQHDELMGERSEQMVHETVNWDLINSTTKCRIWSGILIFLTME